MGAYQKRLMANIEYHHIYNNNNNNNNNNDTIYTIYTIYTKHTICTKYRNRARTLYMYFFTYKVLKTKYINKLWLTLYTLYGLYIDLKLWCAFVRNRVPGQRRDHPAGGGRTERGEMKTEFEVVKNRVQEIWNLHGLFIHGQRKKQIL
jgi:hypothetical protein